MFDMNQLQGMMNRANEAKQQYEDQLNAMAVKGSAGSDAVVVTVNGHKEVTNIEIAEHALKDADILSDQILSALSQAYNQVDEQRPSPLGGLGDMMQGIDLNALGLNDLFKQ